MYLPQIYSENKKSFLKLFFLFFLAEVCIGGSGGLIHLGSLTIRKAEFIVSLGIAFYCFFFKKKVNRPVIYITAVFLVLLIIATIIGFLHYGADERVFENFFMQSFFLMLPFYSLFINNVEDVKKVATIVRIASLALAVAYLLVLILIYLNILNFISVYLILTKSTEFLGRGNVGFWYKGFIYMCVGTYFFQHEKKAWLRYAAEIIIFAAIVLTFVRGFLLALVVTTYIFTLFFKSFWKSLLLLLLCAVAVVLIQPIFKQATLNRNESDRIRVMQLKQVFERTDAVNFLIGNGFGEGVPIRDNHMEINYLEIFYKQGIIGLAFWVFILIYLGLLYCNARANNYEKEARPFFLASIFVYVESATNPFLTNSIGINVILISILSLQVLKNEGKNKLLGSDGNI